MSEQQRLRISFWRELKERRVIQLVGLYMGASWVALEFLGFLVDRYALSPYLIDLVLLAMGAMVPSVLILAFTHGKPGKDQWTTAEKVVVPANVFLTVGLLLVFFTGKDLGATTLVVTAEDETGTSAGRSPCFSLPTKRVTQPPVGWGTGCPRVSTWISSRTCSLITAIPIR